MTDREAELEEEVLQLRQQLKLEPQREAIRKLKEAFNVSLHQAVLRATLYEGGSSWLPADRLDMALPSRSENPRSLDTIKVQIWRLRQLLGDDFILTYYGVGYTLGAAGVTACRKALA